MGLGRLLPLLCCDEDNAALTYLILRVANVTQKAHHPLQNTDAMCHLTFIYLSLDNSDCKCHSPSSPSQLQRFAI